MKNKRRKNLSCFGLVFTACSVFGRFKPNLYSEKWGITDFHNSADAVATRRFVFVCFSKVPNCVIKNAVRSVLFRHINYAVRRVRHRDRDRLKVRQRDRREGEVFLDVTNRCTNTECIVFVSTSYDGIPKNYSYVCLSRQFLCLKYTYRVGGGGEGGERREKRERE